jgi:hypothetical protein
MTDNHESNYLTDLAARIQALHQATTENLRRSVENAMACGDLLIEAKAQLKHGQWLPWLQDHCLISERTAQLYMRTAKNRAIIEAMAKSATVADLTLNETAALLMMSSDVRKLFNFAKDCEHLSGEDLIEHCIAEGVAVIRDPAYDPFAGRSDEEQFEWQIFILFLSFDRAAGRCGFEPDQARDHVEYLLQRPFQNVAEWLGPEGDKWRRMFGGALSEQFRTDWAAFFIKNRDRAPDDVIKELDALQKQFEYDLAAGLLQTNASRRRKARRVKQRPMATATAANAEAVS